MDELLKLVIPAIFLIVWAVGQLLNREAAKPPRPPRPRAAGGLPPRPDLAPRPREAPRLPEPTMRWGDQEESKPPSIPARPLLEPRRTVGDPDEIVILGSETGPPRAAPHRPAARGSSRPRPAPGAKRSRKVTEPSLRVEPLQASSKNLATVAGLTSGAIRPMDVADTAGPLGASMPAESVRAIGSASGPKVQRLRTALATPERIRDALILNEVLGPPVSRRPRRH